MKNLKILLLFLVVNFSSFAQKKMTRTGQITFHSETPMENIDAKNNQVASILVLNEKKVAFNVLMKSFKFDKALMEEHFNEKYVHSDKYPSAKFQGIIQDDIQFEKNKTYSDVAIAGEMTFHGVTKPLKVNADIVIKEDESIDLKTSFPINLEAYQVEVPALVKDKIADEIMVSVMTTYQ